MFKELPVLRLLLFDLFKPIVEVCYMIKATVPLVTLDEVRGLSEFGQGDRRLLYKVNFGVVPEDAINIEQVRMTFALLDELYRAFNRFYLMGSQLGL